MNLSEIVNSIIISNGLMVPLPFTDAAGNPAPIENIVMNVIQNVTIPLYSQFVPQYNSVITKIELLDVIDKHECIYMLPKTLTHTPIMYIKSVEIKPKSPGNHLHGLESPHMLHSGNSVTSAMNSVLAKSHALMMTEQRVKETFTYLGYNKIQLLRYHKSSHLEITAACRHDKSGETITEDCYDSFLQLATLDVKIAVYNVLKMYDGLSSAHGTTQALKLDNLSNAESEKEALLEKWRDVYHIDQCMEFYM